VAVVGVVCSEDVHLDESGVSLLQHAVRTIAKPKMDDLPGPPPAGVTERMTARRDRKRAARAAGEPPRSLTPEQLERRRSRRSAKRQAKQAGHVANTRKFGDGAACDTCAAKCTVIFQDEFKACMLRENCQPWQKEDGPEAQHCSKRCDTSANWLREPCIRNCQCDVDLIMRMDPEDYQKRTLDLISAEHIRISAEEPTKKKKESKLMATSATTNDSSSWAGGHHRCRSVPLGAMSGCLSLGEEADSGKYDSMRKCARAAVAAGADTFNFFRTAKEYGKCSLRQCGSGDLQISQAPASSEPPAGRGNWKVFSTYCDAKAEDQRSDTGEELDADGAHTTAASR